MPFDYDKYREKCNGMTAEQLQKEWENYTRQISAGATSTATSILFMPVTGGASVVGVGLSAPRIHNARKKREIIEAGLKARGTTHHTRKGDVLAPMAVSGIIGGLTLGLVPGGAAESVAGAAVGRGLEIAAANTALNATEAVVVGNARKKAAGELGNQNSQEDSTRYGTVATPFLMDQSVLGTPPPPVFQEQGQLGLPTAGNHATTSVLSTPARTDHALAGGDIAAHSSSNPQCGQDLGISPSLSSLSIQSSADPQEQTIRYQPRSTAPDAEALFASIPTSENSAPIPDIGDDDLFDPHTVEDKALLAMHALTLEMETRETEDQNLNLAPYFQPQEAIQEHTGQIESPQFLPQNRVQALGSIKENQIHTDEIAAPHSSYQPWQEQWSALPLRKGPRSATLPDTQSPQYSPQQLPAYQPQYFSPLYQVGMVTEPQQYCPPPPPPRPQQRQDSGYGSMHSTPSLGSASQFYPPPPNPISRHSSIPQTYPAPPTSAGSSFYSPQMQAYHEHRASESSLYPMTPPPPYFAPPPGMPTPTSGIGKENDYFNQNPVPAPPSTHTNTSHFSFNPLQRGQSIVDEMNKGWQWARANALQMKTPMDSKIIGEPDYGPPPAVPTEWRGS